MSANHHLGEAPQPDLWSVAPPKPRTARPNYHGHRDRLRERAATALTDLPDYELLEMQLFRSIPRGDVKSLAKALMARFGSLAGVLAASPAELKTVAGVGEAVTLDLKLLQEMTLRIGRQAVAKRTVITSWSQLLGYVKIALAHEAREQFR